MVPRGGRVTDAPGLTMVAEGRRTDGGSGQGPMSQPRRQQGPLHVRGASDLILSMDTSLKRACWNLLERRE